MKVTKKMIDLANTNGMTRIGGILRYGYCCQQYRLMAILAPALLFVCIVMSFFAPAQSSIMWPICVAAEIIGWIACLVFSARFFIFLVEVGRAEDLSGEMEGLVKLLNRFGYRILSEQRSIAMANIQDQLVEQAWHNHLEANNSRVSIESKERSKKCFGEMYNLAKHFFPTIPGYKWYWEEMGKKYSTDLKGSVVNEK